MIYTLTQGFNAQLSEVPKWLALPNDVLLELFKRKKKETDKVKGAKDKKGTMSYTSSKEREREFLRQNLPKDKLEELQFM